MIVSGPIAGAAALHFAVSTPNFVIQEEMSGAVSWYDDVVTTPMHRIGSHWQVPTGPGLGVEVDEREAAKHPYQQEIINKAKSIPNFTPFRPMEAKERTTIARRPAIRTLSCLKKVTAAATRSSDTM